VFSITFGLLSAAARAAEDAGLVTMATANTVEEARPHRCGGIRRGRAPGQRGRRAPGDLRRQLRAWLVGTLALVPQAVDAVRVPVLAAGGIMDGRGWVAPRHWAPAGVQLGTAFLAADECGTIPAYKDAVLAASDDGTTVTRAYSGRAARGLVTRFLSTVEERPGTILPYPLQNALTRPMRAAANRAGRAELLSLWAGQAARLARRAPAAEIVRWLLADAARVRASLQAS
jgi:nitronate monooxygenase